MFNDLTAGIVRILDSTGATVGTGFVVTDDGLIATCAHVVEGAGAGPGESVRVAFHATGEERAAEVEPTWWCAPAAEDMAVLRPTSPLPDGVAPLPLGVSVDSEGHAFITFGFPEPNPVEGLRGGGHILGETTLEGVRVLQVRSQEVAQGMSGAPLWDVEAKRIVGMVISTYHTDATLKFRDLGFATPTEVLLEICPELARVLRTRPLRTPFMADELPTDFVQRPEELEPLVASLLVEDRNQVSIVTALCGAGGYGKTTLATALCHDERMRAAFPDGVLWVTLGQDPNLVGDAVKVLRALTGERRALVDTEDAGQELAQALGEKRCLLVIDDVWNEAHTRPFLRGGSHCTRLITTRNRDTLPPGTHVADVDAMQPDEAVQLLKTGLDVGQENIVSHLTRLAARLGEWPLLLGLVNRALQRRVDQGQSLASALAWAERALEKRGLTAFDARNVEARDQAASLTLEVSLELLSEEERARYGELAVFPHDEHILLKAVARLWGATGGLDDFDMEELCGCLFDLSLLRRFDRATRTIQLHDVVRNYLVRQRGERLPALHDRLLEAYAVACERGTNSTVRWPTGPDDGYFFQHLAYHLKKAGRIDELNALLTGTPAWMERKFVACMGDAAYVADLELALDSFEPVEAWTPAQLRMVVQLYTARQVAHERVGRYDDADLETLVWLGQDAKALSYARLRTDAEARFQGLLVVFHTLRERDCPNVALLDEVAKAARIIQHDWAQRDLAIALAQGGRLAEAREVARDIQEPTQRAPALIALWRALAQAGYEEEAELLFAEAREIAGELQEPAQRASVLIALGVSLVQAGCEGEAAPLFAEVEEMVKAIWDDEARASIHRDLVTALTRADRLDRAREMADAIENYEVWADALGDLGAALAQAGREEEADALFGNARAVVDAMWDDDDREIALAALAAALAQAGRFAESREAAKAIGGGPEEETALSALAVALARAGRFDEAQETAAAVWDGERKAGALRALAAALARSGRLAEANAAFEEAMEAVSPQGDEEKQVSVMIALAQVLAQAGCRKEADAVFAQAAISLPGEIFDRRERADKLRDLAIALARTGRDREAGVRFAELESMTRDWVEALCPLALALSQAGRDKEADAVLTRASEVADAIEDDRMRGSALCILATALFQTGHDKEADVVLTKVKALVPSLEDDEMPTYRLGTLAAALAQANHFTDCAEIADLIQEDAERVVALSTLVRALALSEVNEQADAVLAQVQETADAIPLLQDPEGRARALRELAVALAEMGRDREADTVFAQASRAAHAIAPTWPREKALGALAATLAQTGRCAQAREIANAIQNAKIRTVALRDVAARSAQAGHFAQALSTLDLCRLDSFLYALSEWEPAFEQVEPGLAVTTLQQAMRIAGWVRPDWRKIYELIDQEGRE